MRFVASIAIATLLVLPVGAQDKNEQPLAVKKIVVYKHGVGYFEREGKVSGNQQLALTFKAAQMKDLLKSLYAVDLSGGRIATINYDTKDPLSKQLEEVLIQIPDSNALTQFLTQLKGARVEATIAGETTTGSVLGIEPVSKQTKDGTVTSYKLVLFRDDGKIQPVELLEMSSLKVLDDGLQKDLKRLLEIHLKAKHADRKSVILDATGKGERTIRVGYIIETPIWKTSYRLLFEDNQKPLLQGWAILENTTDEDWDQVEASFVAGSPMSFIMDLYTAYYPQRPEIPVGVTSAPKAELQNYAKAAAAAPMAPAGARMRGLAEEARKEKNDSMDRAAEGLARRAELKRSFAEEMESAVGPAAAGVDVGELFAYQAREKISIRRGQAALVPILSERIDGGERVLFYRPSISARPMNSFYFKNTTPLTLEAGPVTFFDGSTCIGEGLMRKVMKKDMKDMLPYAVEAGVTVETKTNHRSDPITRGAISNGVLYLTHMQNYETSYSIKSQLGRDSILYLDHARMAGFSLVEPTKAEDEMDGQYRFKLDLKGGQSVDLKVRETQQVTTQLALVGTPAETIRLYIQQRYLSDAAKKLLGELILAQGEINRLRTDEVELNQERTRLGEDDTRIRQNLGVLRDTASELEMRKKYLQRLQDSDARQEKIREDLKVKAAERAQRERDLSKKVQEFRDE